MKFISILFPLLLLGAVSSYPAHSQWVSTGPFGGPVQSLVVRNRTGESTAFAISSMRGVFRSTDMGDHWIPASTGLPSTAGVYTQAFAVDDTNLWVGIPWSGVYRSTDDGASWVETGLKKTVAAFATAQTASGQKLLYAAIEYKGLYLSSDNGMNWLELNDRIRDTTLYLDTVVGFVNGLAAFANAAGNMTLLAGVEYYGIFRSTDNGAHWTWPLLSDDVNAVDIVPERNGGRTIYASAWDCIYKSTDDGETWTRHNLAARGHVRGVVALPNGSNGAILLAGSDDGIFLSPDNGENWSQKDSGLANPYVRILGRVTGTGGSTAVLAGTGGGIFRSTNAGDLWVRACNGFGGTYAVSLAVFPDGADGGTLFAGTQGDGMFRSTDYGNSWTSVNAGLTTPSINSNAIAVCPNGVGDTNIFVGTMDGAFRSSNKGDSWLPVSNLGLNYPYVGQFAVSGTRLYSVINNAAYRLSNNTYSWLPLAGPPGGASVLVAFPTGSEGTTLLASPNNQGVYRSTDNGANWYQFNTGMYTQHVTTFAVRGNSVFAGTDQGVYRADETLAGWTSMSGGLINRMETSYVVCFATAPDGKGGQNLFVEYGTGIFRAW
jgi:photosystem II stability/assembly factor-like uncharacterized protein